MKRRKIPYPKIFSVVSVVVAASGGSVAAWLTERYSLLVVSVPALLWAIHSLCSIYGEIMRRLNFIFNAVQNDDYTFRFADAPAVTEHALINYSLNRIKEVMDAAKLQIREKEKYFELIMECADIGIITVLQNGAVMQANTKAVRLFGLMRLSHIDQLRPLSAELADTLLRIGCGEHRSVECPTETGELALSISCADMQFDRRELRVITIGDINQAMDAKEIESWNKLTRILTHEIMNSLAPVTSISHMLLTSERDGEQFRSGLQTIHTTSERLLAFVDSFRQVTRIPAPQRAPFYLTELLAEAEALTDLSHIAFERRIEPGDLMLYADRTLMSQVLVNLLKNACEAVAALPADRRAVSVHAGIGADERISIEVSNTGEPIPAEVAANIFTPFFTTKPDGSGIGLAVSRQIVRLHGGSLRLSHNTTDRIAFTIVME